MANELDRLEQLELSFADKQPARALLVRRVRSWRSNWLELATELHGCVKEKQYTTWGFGSFEEYHKQELGLSVAEVGKLLSCRQFLLIELTEEKAAPAALTLDQVEVARKAMEAAEDGAVTKEVAEEIKAAVKDGKPAAEQKRKLQSALQSKAPAAAAPALQKKVLRTSFNFLAMCEQLGQHVPPALIERLRKDIDELQGVLTPGPEEPPATAAATQKSQPRRTAKRVPVKRQTEQAPAPGPFVAHLFPEEALEASAVSTPETAVESVGSRRWQLIKAAGRMLELPVAGWAVDKGFAHAEERRRPLTSARDDLTKLFRDCPTPLENLKDGESKAAFALYKTAFAEQKKCRTPRDIQRQCSSQPDSAAAA